jgi:hypothetical protein
MKEKVMGQVIKMAKYRHNILVTHSLPDGFNAELAKALGIDECQSAMGHAAALKRIFAIRVEDLAAILLETGSRFGSEKWWRAMLSHAVERIDGLLDCRSLERAVAVARSVWEEDQIYGSTALAAFKACRRILMARYSAKWQPLDEFMKHVVLLIEACRLERRSPFWRNIWAAGCRICD